MQCAPIDNGADNIKSRHTTYWVKNQYDPLTDYGLKTIPDGEFASVRLGNWNVYREAERIEYKYHVDSIDPGILILKYAVVLQDPEHTEREQPYFQLTLLNEKNQELDPTCGKAQFTADRDMEGWKTATPYSDKNNVVTYKDWTTLGINLDDYKDVTSYALTETYNDVTLTSVSLGASSLPVKAGAVYMVALVSF